MKAAHKLRVVPNCPQPDPPPYKPIKYVAAERILARSVAESITVTTPGRVTWHQIRRKRASVWGLIGWLPVVAALVLCAFAVITR